MTMRKTDRLLFQSTKEALLWLMRNYKHKWYYYQHFLVWPDTDQDGETSRKVLVGVNTIKNILHVRFY